MCENEYDITKSTLQEKQAGIYGEVTDWIFVYSLNDLFPASWYVLPVGQ